jgi:hypothetical protein
MAPEHLHIVGKKAETARLARAELREAIRKAHAAGDPLSAIGEAAGLSKQRIHQIIQKTEGKHGKRNKGGDDA